MARHHPGDKVQLKVDRFGKVSDFTVTLNSPEGKSKTTKKDLPRELSSLGADFKDADEKTCKRLGFYQGDTLQQASDMPFLFHRDLPF